MNAYDIMREWDNATGKGPRSDEEFDQEVPILLAGTDYEEWKTALEARDVRAIRQGMKLWGLPIEPLERFDLDSGIETEERTYEPRV